MPWIDAFAPIEERYRQEVEADTWGHLAPKKNVVYRGRITFAIGIYGDDSLNPTVIDCELTSKKYGELTSSPWFYDALQELMSDWMSDGRYGAERELPKSWPHLEAGGVYRWIGTFRNYEFDGELRQLRLI